MKEFEKFPEFTFKTMQNTFGKRAGCCCLKLARPCEGNLKESVYFTRHSLDNRKGTTHMRQEFQSRLL